MPPHVFVTSPHDREIQDNHSDAYRSVDSVEDHDGNPADTAAEQMVGNIEGIDPDNRNQ